MKPMLDIIIPVYRGLVETRACIESVLASQLPADCEVVVINDASPEPELVAWLQQHAGHFTLLHNDTNLGFVATVNRGMRLHPARDVILLNSDTRVHGDWVQRLRRSARQAPEAGSLTPWSNNATICSYPLFCADNPLPPGMDLAAIDSLCARALPGQRVALPTAVGFCMFIRRQCLDAVGLFDEQNFGKGYGEENAFCLRASQAGWRHYLAADVFVYHAGGVSFAETQAGHQRHGHQALLRQFPHYDLLVQDYVARDPARPLRFMLDLLRIGLGSRPRVLLISHARAGGTRRHVEELAARLGNQADFILLQPEVEQGAVRVGLLDAAGWHNTLTFAPSAANRLLAMLQTLRLTRVHYHHWIGLHPRFLRALTQLELPIDLTLHDCYLACPQVTFTDAAGRYCQEPEAAGCNQCLRQRPVAGALNIEQWRSQGADWLAGVARILAPTADVAARFQRYFPHARVQVVSHEPELVTAPVRALAPTANEPLRILVLGALSPFKGPDTLEACARAAAADDLPLQFHLLGEAYRSLSAPAPWLQLHGRYAEAALPQHLQQLRPHLVWFPGSCPETWSYTLSAALSAGLPVVASAIGAFPERLAGRDWSWLVATDRPVASINAHFMAIRQQLAGAEPVRAAGTPLTECAFSYQQDYLAADERTVQPAAADDILAHLRSLLWPIAGFDTGRPESGE